MSNLFDNLEDETPPTTGEEIGSALAGAVSELGKSNEAMGRMIARAISDALKAAGSKQVVVEKSSVKEWKFKVLRDKNGNLNEILATAIFQPPAGIDN
ncbi:MAG: hypothetical protein A2V79_09155 [Betaproteobacteria bacterium RBG_16_56_24]|nr:MAG: hypothetical protein A2V79_09155 [Betaproteobacteria bacterium RBG_16_56_24]